MQHRKALGRGLESLMGPEVIPSPMVPSQTMPPQVLPPVVVPLQDLPSLENRQGLHVVAIDKIFPNRQQPREEFEEEGLKDLTASIKADGILQPLVVAPSSDGRYELIAGERRFRAAKAAGLTEVPVVIRNADEQKRLELALVENVQRKDLNAMEEAKGYQSLCDRFGYNHADVAEKVGKSREHVANSLRLLKLPRLVQEDVSQGKISSSHARALLALPSLQDQLYFREKILQEGLSVRDIERMIQDRIGFRKKIRRNTKLSLSPQMKLVKDELEKTLATKVRFQPGIKEGEGKIVIDYYSGEDLDRIYRKIVS